MEAAKIDIRWLNPSMVTSDLFRVIAEFWYSQKLKWHIFINQNKSSEVLGIIVFLIGFHLGDQTGGGFLS